MDINNYYNDTTIRFLIARIKKYNQDREKNLDKINHIKGIISEKIKPSITEEHLTSILNL